MSFDEVVPGLVECGVNRIRLFLSEGTEKSRTAATAIPTLGENRVPIP